eukprot:scaffold49_cov409-Prasinococcus_capsulatus_cf.AAC.47
MAAVLPALLPRQLIGARRRPACRVRGPAGAAASQRLCRAARVLSGAEVRGTRLGRARASKQPTSTPAPLCQASSDNTSSVFLDIEVNGEAVGRLNIRLENDVAPMSCRNFEMLCTGQMRNEDPLFSLKVRPLTGSPAGVQVRKVQGQRTRPWYSIAMRRRELEVCEPAIQSSRRIACVLGRLAPAMQPRALQVPDMSRREPLC